jgi:hypothetical protein
MILPASVGISNTEKPDGNTFHSRANGHGGLPDVPAKRPTKRQIHSTPIQLGRYQITEGVTMSNLENAIQQLREERKQAQIEVRTLDQAISVIESLNGTGVSRQSSRPYPNRVLSFTSQDGAGATSAMGEGAGTFVVNIGGKDHQFRSCQAHNISSRQKEDRGGTAGEVGEVEGCEEEIGGLSNLRNLLRRVRYRLSRLPHPEISSQKLLLATVALGDLRASKF